MKKILTLALVLWAGSLFATTAAPAPAHSGGNVHAGKIGVDFSYASTIPTFGMRWHLTDMIALKPSVGFSSTTTTTTTTVGAVTTVGETSPTNIVFGLGVPIYIAKFNLLSAYVSPEFTYTITSTKVTTVLGSASASGSSLSASGAFGLQVAINDQIHVFGELGFGYSSTESAGGTTKTTGLGTTRSAVGAIFYFN